VSLTPILKTIPKSWWLTIACGLVHLTEVVFYFVSEVDEGCDVSVFAPSACELECKLSSLRLYRCSPASSELCLLASLYANYPLSLSWTVGTAWILTLFECYDDDDDDDEAENSIKRRKQTLYKAQIQFLKKWVVWGGRKTWYVGLFKSDNLSIKCKNFLLVYFC